MTPALLPGLSGDSGNFRVVNDFARDTPWLHGFMEFMATDGIALLALALLAGWWLGRRDCSPRKVAAAVWAALAALAAVAIAQPIAGAVDERRPFVVVPHALTLIKHANDVGFPSDHSTAAGAIAAGLFVVSWRLGLVTAFVAALIAFSRIYVGVHFPQDVAAGIGLGVVVALLGVVLVVPLLTRVMVWLTRSPLRPLITRTPPDLSGRSREETPSTS